MNEQNESRFYRDLLRAYFDSANDAIFVLCDEMKFLACNRIMQEWIGRGEDELTRHNARIPITQLLSDPGSAEVFRAHFPAALAGEHPRFELLLTAPGTSDRWVEMNLNRVAVEAGDMVMAVARDITERRIQEQRVRYNATHDALTGLPNRSYFIDGLTRAMKSSAQGALLVFDLNRLRDVNERLGHTVGDMLLRTAAERLMAVAADSPHARVGSNEFTLWLPVATEEMALAFADRLRRRMVEPVGGQWGGYQIEVATGIALYPQHAQNADLLLRSAEIAMYKAKSSRIPAALFDPDESRRNVRRLRLANDLKHAIEAGEIDVHYQPMVALREPLRFRVEALARWRHPEFGHVPPDEFIPLSEHTGSIHSLTQFVLARAMADCAPLVGSGQIVSISVNLSPVCLVESALPEMVSGLKTEYGLPARSLVFEITETAIMADPQRSRVTLEALHRQGVDLAVDDFGTGHASFAKLRQFPVSEVKIDRSFVVNMQGDPGDAAIVRAALQLASTFGCRAVAEGIETIEVRDLLVEYGCDYGQGFFIARPMPFAGLMAWLRDHKP